MCPHARSHRHVSIDAHDAVSLDSIQPYRNHKEFQSDLQQVLEEDYGVTLIGVQLEEAATNVNQFLKAFL